MNRILAAAAIAALAFAAPALAQVTPPVSTGTAPMTTSPTGGIPPAAGGAGDRTGSITGVGQTKPPGDPVGSGQGTRPDLERKSEELDRKINTGICKGC